MRESQIDFGTVFEGFLLLGTHVGFLLEWGCNSIKKPTICLGDMGGVFFKHALLAQ